MIAAPADFPLQRVAQRRGLDFGNDQIGLAGEVLFDGFGKLFCGRKVDEPVGNVDRRSVKSALGFKLPPLILGQNLIDERMIHGLVGGRIAEIFLGRTRPIGAVPINLVESGNLTERSVNGNTAETSLPHRGAFGMAESTFLRKLQ